MGVIFQVVLWSASELRSVSQIVLCCFYAPGLVLIACFFMLIMHYFNCKLPQAVLWRGSIQFSEINIHSSLDLQLAPRRSLPS